MRIQMDIDWERVSEDHPECCETQGCLNKSLTGSRFCAAHGGNKGVESAEAASLKNYRLTKFHKQVQEKEGSSNIKSLTGEIAMLRQMVEEQWNSCEDANDLILKSGPISDLHTKIEKLVNSCNNIDKTLGNLIDKEKVVLFAQTIVSIISPYIPEDKLDEINFKIQESIRLL